MIQYQFNILNKEMSSVKQTKRKNKASTKGSDKSDIKSKVEKEQVTAQDANAQANVIDKEKDEQMVTSTSNHQQDGETEKPTAAQLTEQQGSTNRTEDKHEQQASLRDQTQIQETKDINNDEENKNNPIKQPPVEQKAQQAKSIKQQAETKLKQQQTSQNQASSKQVQLKIKQSQIDQNQHQQQKSKINLESSAIQKVQIIPQNLKQTEQNQIKSEHQIQHKQKHSESPEPIILIDSTGVGSNQDLQQQAVKQTKTSRRLAKFKEKQKKSNPKKQDKSPQYEKPVTQPPPPPKKHIISSTVSNLKSKFTKSIHDIQQIQLEKDMDEYKMLLVMIQSKKKENYKTLKEWDDKRIQELSVHLNVVDGFERTLDNLARTSFENIEIYYSTFRQIYNQQEKYANHPMIDTVYTTKHNNLSKNVYINCSCILNALNEQNMQRAKKAKQFGEFIKSTILQSIFSTHLKQTQKFLTQIKSKISTLKTVLINAQGESDKKSEHLAHSFANNLMLLDDKKDQDFYEIELDFLRLSHSIVDIHRQYAEMILEYYDVIKRIEGQRAQVIKKAIKTYSQAIQSTYQSKTGVQSLQQLLKGEESQLIEEFYSLQELIPVNYQQIIKHKINIKEEGFTLAFLRQYFRNFNIQKFDLRQLILKQYSITNQTTGAQNSTLIITVDRFIHIFSTLEHYTQPTATFKIDPLLKIKRKNNQVSLQTLPEKKSGVFGMFGWGAKSSSSISIIFPKRDSAEEAQDYIKKLI